MTPQPNSTDQLPPSGISELADSYVDQMAALDPVLATGVGIVGHDTEMTDWSPEGWAERAELNRRTLRALDELEPATAAERIAKLAMQERLGLDLERFDAGVAQHDLNVTDSPLQSQRSVFDLMARETDDHWQAIASRLALVPATLAGFRRSLEESVRAGDVVARRQILSCSEQCARWSGERGGQSFYPDLIAGYRGEGALRSELAVAATAANDAVMEFGHWLRDELSGAGRQRDAVGRDAYAFASRYFLGATVDLDETYDWGWEELGRIVEEQREVAGRIRPGAGVEEAVTALDADPARKLVGADALRRWMQDLSDRAVASLAGTHFDIPEPIRRLDCRIAPTHEGGAYYTGPSEDFSRPGTMWWSIPEGDNEFTTWSETSTVFHEGVPGHHLQVAQAVYRADLLNRWQRMMCWVSGHGEGWALYAERLMAELGWLDDPGDRLGMLMAHRMRAARVVLDIGMHLEKPIPEAAGLGSGLHWDADHGLAFLRDNSTMSEGNLKQEIERYLGWPGQAPSYKLGERFWLTAREEARQRAGDAFDLKAFHRAALDLGSLGLDPLREALRGLT